MIEYSSLEISAPLPTLLIIPSGIGCSVGGFAGDAIPAARLLAAASGCLITHPKVLNGASLYWPFYRRRLCFSGDRTWFGCKTKNKAAGWYLSQSTGDKVGHSQVIVAGFHQLETPRWW